MYHSEGYVDRQSYFIKGNMWNFGMEQGGRCCYFWYVMPYGTETSERKSKLVSVLPDWFHQELPVALERGGIYIQKELNRFGAYLSEAWKEAQQPDVPEGWPLLYLYFNGRMYFCGKDAEEVGWSVIGGVGVCISCELTMLRETMKCLADSNAERGNMVQTGAAATVMKVRDTRRLHMAKVGNAIKMHMLEALSEGRMKQGFFMIWEDEYAV